MIEVKNLHKSFGDNHVLRGLNFSVPQNHITGLIGPNGSGKSTTIRILTGFSDPDAGSVTVNGKPMSVSAVETKRLIGYAPENAASYREHTVKQYLTFIARLRGVPKSDVKTEVERAVDAFALAPVYTQAIGTLSKGYRHRTSLGQCLLGDPPVIIMDEPTDGLDPIQKIDTRDMILELAKTKAILLTTHLLEEVDMLCDRVVAIGGGDIVFSGTMKDAKSACAADAIINIRMAGTTQATAEKTLGNIKGLLSHDVKTAGAFITAQLAVRPAGGVTPQDVLNEVSTLLFAQKIRVVELHQMQSSLTNIFTQANAAEG